MEQHIYLLPRTELFENRMNKDLLDHSIPYKISIDFPVRASGILIAECCNPQDRECYYIRHGKRIQELDLDIIIATHHLPESCEYYIKNAKNMGRIVHVQDIPEQGTIVNYLIQHYAKMLGEIKA